MTRKTKFTAFTLIEMLVVVALISILISLLLPALGKTGKKAESLICQDVLKNQVGALLLYAVDNLHTLPPLKSGNTNFEGKNVVNSYAVQLVKKGYVSDYESFFEDPSTERDSNNRLDYGINHYGRATNETDLFWDSLGTAGGNGTLRFRSVANQDVIYLACADTGDSPWDIGGVSRGKGFAEWPIRYSFQDEAYKRHDSGYNTASPDGSVKWYFGDYGARPGGANGAGNSVPIEVYEPWFIRKRR